MASFIKYPFFFLMLLYLKVSGQDFPLTNETPEQKTSFWDNVFFGGDLGLQFGSYTLVKLSPLAGYNFNESFSAGIGVQYIYMSIRNSNYYNDFSTSIYGGSVFGRYYFIDNIFAHIEYEALSMGKEWDYRNKYPDKNRFLVESYLVGGGYKQMIGNRSSMVLMILWNLNETDYSVYANPVIRLGFNF